MIEEESCHARCFARAYAHIIEVSFLGWHGTRKFMMRASANSATKKLLWNPKGSVVASSAFIPRCREKKESASDELIIHNYRRLLKQTTDYPDWHRLFLHRGCFSHADAGRFAAWKRFVKNLYRLDKNLSLWWKKIIIGMKKFCHAYDNSVCKVPNSSFVKGKLQFGQRKTAV